MEATSQGGGRDQRAATYHRHEDHTGEVVAGEVGRADPGLLLWNPVRHEREPAAQGARAVEQQQREEELGRATHGALLLRAPARCRWLPHEAPGSRRGRAERPDAGAARTGSPHRVELLADLLDVDAQRPVRTATSAQERAAGRAAGTSLLTLYDGGTFATSYVLGVISTLVFSATIVRYRTYGRFPGVVGLVTGVTMLVPANIATVGLVLAMVSLVPTALWLILLGSHLLRSARRPEGVEQGDGPDQGVPAR